MRCSRRGCRRAEPTQGGAHGSHTEAGVWEGYVNPHYRECPDCENGETSDYRWLHAATYLLGMLGDNAGRSRIHPWLAALPFAPAGLPCPGPDLAKLTTALAGRPPSPPFGHDACDQHAITRAIIKAAGLPEDWGTCPRCRGSAIDPSVRAAYEAWTKSEPPHGPGFQLWETRRSPRSAARPAAPARSGCARTDGT